jgi:hypothetical protein
MHLITEVWIQNGKSLVETIKVSVKVLFNGKYQSLCDPRDVAIPLTMFSDSKILSLGLAQTLFECSMYIFVLLYTPALEQALEDQRKLFEACLEFFILLSK